MHFISAKVWLWLAALLVFLSSCSREGTDPVWEAQSPPGFDNEYYGGLFPVYIVLKEPVDDESSISWSTRYARIAYRNQNTNSRGQIIADTAFLYWEAQPPAPPAPPAPATPTASSASASTPGSEIVETHKDTIFAIVNNVPSLPIVIDVKNILPRIKSIKVGNKPPQAVDSLLTIATIAANLGDKLTISIELEKVVKNEFHPIIIMPSSMGSSRYELSEDELTFNYEWTVRNSESDSYEYLTIRDSRGQGEMKYKVHLVAYTECGSVWVAAEKELVKYSPTGIKVAGITQMEGDFNSISDISVNSKNGKLFVVDESKNSFTLWNNYGEPLNNDKKQGVLFKPSGIAVDVEGDYVWIADIKGSASFGSSSSKSSSSVSSALESSSGSDAKLRRFLLVSNELNNVSEQPYEMPGPIKGLSINQFQSNFVWFAIPKSNKVGFTIEPPEPKFLEPKLTPNAWNRPSMVSHDLSNGTIWIADSSRVVAIDTSGNVLVNIKEFKFVSSVSASKGNVWVSDILSGIVYLFKEPPEGFKGNWVAGNGKPLKNFIAPISVSAYTADGGAWVIDKEKGMAVRLNSNGDIIASGTGLKLPILGKTVQKVE
ncbi:hypothetical protein R83H12_00640 [Fibrobacteria bacterium R8-3-H12]